MADVRKQVELDILSLFEQSGDMARRRGQRKGYLFRKGPSWFLRYRVDTPEVDERGRFKRKEITKYVAPALGPGKVSKREAERIAYVTYLVKLDQSSTRPQSMLTVREFVTERFEPDHVWSLKPSGKAHYENMLKNHVLPVLGDVKLRDVTTPHVQALVRRTVDSGRSVQTALHAKNAVSAIFRHAKTLGWYSGDLPTEGVKLPEMVRKERGALTWPQVLAITKQLPAAVIPARSLGEKRDAYKRQLLQSYGTLFLLLPVAGLRIGEALGLQWSHFNATDSPVLAGTVEIPPHCVLITKSYTRKPKRFRTANDEYGSTKSVRGRRPVPLPEWLEKMLLRLRSRAQWTTPNDPVFAASTGKPLNANNMEKRVLKQAAALAGMGTPATGGKLAQSWVSFHWFRHTASTLQEQAGLTTAERQGILGHATAEMTLHYTHADLEKVRSKMELIVDPETAAAVLLDFEKTGPIQ